MIGTLRIVAFVLLICLCSFSFCLNPNRPLTQSVIDIWTNQQGLPVGRIHEILQGPDGYLWLVTDDGLARFDGLHFTIFDSQNTKAFASDTVIDLLFDHEGTLWASLFNGGIVQYKNGEFSAFPQLLLPSDMEAQLLRISQEALNNAMKHSRASLASVHLEFERLKIRLSTQDNGAGSDPEKTSFSGFGIIGMKERAAAIGGQFSVKSAPEQGTTVLVEVPI